MKTCKAEGCQNRIWGKGYCQRHQYLRPDYKAKTIKPYSEKRSETNKEYYAKRDVFLKENPVCAIKSEVCTKKATCVHHTRGRGIYLMDVKTWEPACKNCNNYVEQNDQWARDNGHKLSRIYKGRK